MSTNDYPKSLVERVWNLRWSDHLPKKVLDDIYIDYVNYDQAQVFVKSHFPEIYHITDYNSQFQEKDDRGFKDKYYQAEGDFFLFRKEDETPVGMAVGSFLDWSSYNFRNMAILPEYQAIGIYPEFFFTLVDILKKHHVKKIEGDISPTNKRHIHVVNKFGMVVDSLRITETWGALLHFTYFLDEELEDNFAQRYSGTYASDKKNKKA